MIAGSLEWNQLVRSLTRKAIVSLSGCRFAAVLAGHGGERLAWSEFHEPYDEIRAALDGLFLRAGSANQAATAIFPDMRTADSLLDVLAELSSGSRWSIVRIDRENHDRDDPLVAVRWQTDAGDWSTILGLAPMGEMPVHRRAPYFAMSLWPGTKQNPYHQSDEGEVGFVDMPMPASISDKETHRRLWEESRQGADARRAWPREAGAHHTVSFCLPARLAAQVDALVGQ